MIHAIRIHETGGPEVLRWDEIELAKPGPGEVRIRQTASGLNFIDVYHRAGLYKMPLPMVLGSEGAGIVEEVGPDVAGVKPGQRVAYAMERGSYAEARLIKADRVVPIPDGISDQQAAAMMLKGMTAQYLIRRTYRVKSGDTILVQAAAGGVGLILCQWAKHLGATVIGTAGSEAKAALAKSHGADHVILYDTEDLVARVRDLTGGGKVAAVYDSVGKDTFMKSLDCLKLLGTMVLFGQSSGPVPPFDPNILNAKGSLFLTRPSLAAYTATREDLLATAKDLFEIVLSGAVKIEVNQTYKLQDAAQAHRDLESRKTTGSTVLTM
jgi:NADPH2:quinone reductase